MGERMAALRAVLSNVGALITGTEAVGEAVGKTEAVRLLWRGAHADGTVRLCSRRGPRRSADVGEIESIVAAGTTVMVRAHRLHHDVVIQRPGQECVFWVRRGPQ
ncbi:hypothetical protein ACIBKY_51505 [Nonomuraea sp. NPDC050394]|uniref:hypothetical protein n=1 Tax=Nonomuraea sp. NPDC050394 TaxID=3364363 RepID=UPI0037AB7CAA